MFRKKFAVLLAAAMVALTFVGCKGGDDTKTDAPAVTDETPSTTEDTSKDDATDKKAPDEPIKIGVINNEPDKTGYRTANITDIQETFTEENGFEATFVYSQKHDEQVAAAEKFVKDEVDYLLISAAEPAGWDSVLQEAQKVGTRVIVFGNAIDSDESLYEAAVVSDMEAEGKRAVDWLEEQNLEEYKIVHIQGSMGSVPQLGRSAALEEKVGAEEKWTFAIQQAADWNSDKAKQIVKFVIDSGEKFNVIYAENDEMAKGAVAALDEANIPHGIDKDVIVIGFDCNKWALEEVLAGNWNYDGQCVPFQASYIKDIIEKLNAGKTLDEKVTILDEKGFDASTITQEDVDKFGI